MSDTSQFGPSLPQDLKVGTVFKSGLGDSAWLLYGITRSMKPEICVEIGSARGKSACYVAAALEQNGRGKLFAIDPHAKTAWNDDDSIDTFDTMCTNLSGLGLRDRVEIVRSTSTEAGKNWTMPIDLLFIDGDHSYEGVRNDWKLFSPRVSAFGVVVFHDTIWKLRPDPGRNRPDMGVPRFVEELRRDRFQVVTIDKDYGVSVVQPVRGGVPLVKT